MLLTLLILFRLQPLIVFDELFEVVSDLLVLLLPSRLLLLKQFGEVLLRRVLDGLLIFQSLLHFFQLLLQIQDCFSTFYGTLRVHLIHLFEFLFLRLPKLDLRFFARFSHPLGLLF